MFTKQESNLCKGIAIILMLFHHLFNDFEEYAGYTVNYWPFTSERIYFFALLAKICVAVFVFISGYGITATYRKKFSDSSPAAREIGCFVWNRYWKIMTGYWFVFALTLLCQPLGRTIFDAYGHDPKGIVLYLLIDFFGLANLFGTPTLNPTWWYISLAFSIIILMPFVLALMRKMGAFSVMAAGIILLSFWGTANPNTAYLFSMLLGAFCCEKQIFEKIAALWDGKTGGQICKILLELILMLLLISYRTEYNYYGIIDGLIALTIALLAQTLLIHVRVFSPCMQFLGKHSANMFLVHNQLYSFYFLGFFYSFRHWLLILAVLTAVSLLVSVLIEFLKAKSGYQRHIKQLGERLSAINSLP